MATKYLTPFAPAVAQVATATFGTYDATTTRKITIGGYVVSALDTGGTLTAALTALAVVLNASTEPYFAAITWTSSATQIIGTAKVAGIPFTFSGSVSGGTGTCSNAYTVSTVSSGPNDWSTAANYSDGALPITGDTLILSASSVSMTQGCAALSGVTLAELRIDPSYTGNIGLDYSKFTTDADGKTTTSIARKEYRQPYFQVSATIANLNSGGQRLCLDLGSVASTVNVNGTTGSAPAAEASRGAPPLRIICNHASTVINVRGGILGVAYEIPAETSTLSKINIADQSGKSEVFTGRGITLTTFISQSGTHEIESNQTITTATVNGGTVTFEGTGAITTLNANIGTAIANNSGGITTVNAGTGATLNTQGCSLARTIGTLNWNGAILMIDFTAVTVTTWAIQAGLTDKVVTLSMK